MTNEEKARKIEEEYTYEAYVGALEMAEWKDRRFKEYLEKKKRDLSFRSDWSAYENTIYNDCLAEIINELFKED